MGVLYTGGSGSVGTPPPPEIPDTIAGLTHRWHPLRATTASDGVTVTAHPDAIAGTPDNLTRTVFEVGSPEPLLVIENGYAHIEYRGIDMSSSIQLTPPYSWYAVFSNPPLTPVTGKPLSRLAGIELSRSVAGSGRVRLQWGSSPVTTGDIHSNTAGWQSAIVIADPTGGSFALINGVLLTPSGGTYTPLGSGGTNVVSCQMGDGAGGGANVAKIRDRAAYAGKWTLDQAMGLYLALKAEYTDIV